jgi:hypothetical protein
MGLTDVVFHFSVDVEADNHNARKAVGVEREACGTDAGVLFGRADPYTVRAIEYDRASGFRTVRSSLAEPITAFGGSVGEAGAVAVDFHGRL